MRSQPRDLPRWLAFLAVLLSIAVACQSAPIGPSPAQKPAKSLTFMAGYKPQANLSFVGVYVAQEKGFFRDQNLEVEIKHSSGNSEHPRLLAAKQIQVITGVSDSVVRTVAAEGLPFVSLAVVTQKSESALVTLKSSGIDAPKKLEGKVVGYKVRPAFDYLMMLKQAGVDRSKIQEVPVGFDPRILTEKKVDGLPVFKSNEPDLLRRLGFELNVFDPSVYGSPALGQTWMANRELLEQDPDLYERFLKAALKGLAFALDNVPEAVDIVMKYADKEDRDHQEFMLRTERESALTDLTRKNGLGWQTLDQWSRLQDAMVEFGDLKQKTDPSQFFTDSVLKKIYANGQMRWP